MTLTQLIERLPPGHSLEIVRSSAAPDVIDIYVEEIGRGCVRRVSRRMTMREIEHATSRATAFDIVVERTEQAFREFGLA